MYAEKWFPTMTPTSKIVASLIEWDVHTTTRAVDSAGQTQIDLASLKYPTSYPVIKDKFDPTIHYIRDEFYRNRVLIHPTCKLLVETLRSGTLNKKKTDLARTSTLGHMDALMSLIYGLRSVNRVTDKRPRPNREKTFVTNPTPHYISQLKKL